MSQDNQPQLKPPGPLHPILKSKENGPTRPWSSMLIGRVRPRIIPTVCIITALLYQIIHTCSATSIACKYLSFVDKDIANVIY